MALLIEAHLRIFGYSRTSARLSRWRGTPLDLDPQYIMRLSRLASDKVLGKDRKCLRRALLAHWYLHRCGHPAELRIGYRKASGKVIGHAWIELHGQVLGDDPEVSAAYPIRFPAAQDRHQSSRT
ncbi:lasso peptide biosynthesis B2 protein [Rhodobacteraceae bacterium N5(2021)]|uniref:Lasso peptide biosynthesis B2 protein n=2 Tax=Gymnodinialimonas phycosphaerae TaxID=2841589 RepID=A0A975TUG7_9RHOB|nr:lasso peptide biosynthesis B2 protein [Gymnodinialimonas phycosphaerae]